MRKLNIERLESRDLMTGNFLLSVDGPDDVYLGHDLYFNLNGLRVAGETDHVYIGMSNLPSGVTGVYHDVSKTCCGPFMWLIGSEFSTAVKLGVASDAQPGTYTMTLDITANGVPQSQPFTFTIHTLPTVTPPLPYETLPDLPGLAQYNQQMIEKGTAQLCNRDAILALGVWEGNVWYYDGARVGYQIADYTGNPDFAVCAKNPLDAYRPYVLNNNGFIPGWRNFAQGFRMDYERTGDELSKEAAIDLTNAAFGPNGIMTGYQIPDAISRETAYAIDTMIEIEKLGVPRNPRLEEYVDVALGHIDQWFSSDPGYYQPFMFGLTAEALIKYHALTGDPRILPALKIATDWTWEHTWVAADRSFVYEYFAGQPLTSGAPDLNMLVVPVFGWLYEQTGDPLYIQRGDQAFVGGVEGAWLDNGKQFSQNYRWSMDYLDWRDQIPVPPPPPPPPQPVLKVLDDGDAGTSQSGSWKTQLGKGVLGDIHISNKGNGSAIYTWGFTDLPASQYTVWATWTKSGVNATNAKYTVQDTTTTVNQRIAPNNLLENGTRWKLLGVATIDGTLTVKLNNAANGKVVADAIRVERVLDPAAVDLLLATLKPTRRK